ncbi:hypothetical protein B0H19DRAFT_1319397 [Mycena capillaripes]|nr:hypothetical protein B0H19DRAFT_1319397 [Mycena capillaripes]
MGSSLCLHRSALTLMIFGDYPRPFPYVQNAPRLTNVALRDCAHEIVPLPWTSIRCFSEMQEMSTEPVEKYLKLLRKTPHLESLDVSYPSNSSSSSQSTLTHRSLRCLRTSDGNLIRCLSLPNLEELSIEPTADTMPAIRDLLKQSKCSLRKLRLTKFTLDKDTVDILSSCINLQTLIVSMTGWNAKVKETTELSVEKLADPSFLPCLEDLDIAIWPKYAKDRAPLKRPHPIAFINDAFVDILAARWEGRRTTQGGAHLKRVSVVVQLPSTVGLSKTRGVDRLRKMCHEGLDVVIKARDPRALDLDQHAKLISYVFNV